MVLPLLGAWSFICAFIACFNEYCLKMVFRLFVFMC